jgi:hypothetical protein
MPVAYQAACPLLYRSTAEGPIDDQKRIGVVAGGGQANVTECGPLDRGVGEEETLLKNALFLYRRERPLHTVGVCADPVHPLQRRAAWKIFLFEKNSQAIGRRQVRLQRHGGCDITIGDHLGMIVKRFLQELTVETAGSGAGGDRDRQEKKEKDAQRNGSHRTPVVTLMPKA